MWMWTVSSFIIITKVHGFANGEFPQSCASMLPVHPNRDGSIISPKNSEPPYEVQADQDVKKGAPITVFLRGKSTTFQGFILEARKNDMLQEGRPVGKFTLLDPAQTQLLTCNRNAGSAVSQTTNQEKNLIRVHWTPEGEDLNITFRATVVQSYATFWQKVDFTLPPQTSTTVPSTTKSTTEPSTTKSTTEPSTATSTTVPSTTNSTTKKAATALTSVDSLFVVLKMELSNLGTILTNSPFSHHLTKGLEISCSVICAVVEISALILFYEGDSSNVTLVALVSVVMVINFMELIFVSLPFEPHHEMKEICNLVFKVCSVIHNIITIAVVFIGVYEIDSYNKDRTEPWLLTVMAAYTAWIFLSVIWVFVFSLHRRIILRSEIGGSETSERSMQPKIKKTLTAAEMVVTAVSVFIISGATSFTIAIIVGISGRLDK
ncbi:putative ferric-chelate reductase 1 isoform X5 [Mastacembelus armatus]|uniref:putative ferric-chelate reductase 1 isoform X5 n=1 Tax=Mastacembelus armatus TaxID=205130 RepID=UPI000E45A1DB|nr:putative ferric-chelate reductase 1 isoform X5 [Mastacembelus armatus]